MNLGKIIENYVKPIIHKSYYNFKYGKNHKRGAQIPEVWGSPMRRHRLHASTVAGTLSALPVGLYFGQPAPPIAHSCLGSLLRTALQSPLFWGSSILQRLVKPNLLCKASPTPCSPLLWSLSRPLPVPLTGRSFFGVWCLWCPCSLSAIGRRGLGAPSGWGQCLSPSFGA